MGRAPPTGSASCPPWWLVCTCPPRQRARCGCAPPACRWRRAGLHAGRATAAGLVWPGRSGKGASGASPSGRGGRPAGASRAHLWPRATAGGDQERQHAEQVQPVRRHLRHRPQHLQAASRSAAAAWPMEPEARPGQAKAWMTPEPSGGAAAERTYSWPLGPMKTSVSSLACPGEMNASGRSPRRESTSRACPAGHMPVGSNCRGNRLRCTPPATAATRA